MLPDSAAAAAGLLLDEMAVVVLARVGAVVGLGLAVVASVPLPAAAGATGVETAVPLPAPATPATSDAVADVGAAVLELAAAAVAALLEDFVMTTVDILVSCVVEAIVVVPMAVAEYAEHRALPAL
jgi:hypothetical protein